MLKMRGHCQKIQTADCCISKRAMLLLCLVLADSAASAGGAGSVATVSGYNKRGRLRIPMPIDADSQRSELANANKASECRFGDNRYELEQTWNPDLGPPFGVMHCVHCECVPIHKKRRIVGRVRCRSIKEECPPPSCPDPILLPGRCCKVCPGQTNNPDLNIDVDLAREEEEKNGRDYAALLSHGTSFPNLKLAAISSNTSFGIAATGRFSIRKKSLSYSFVISENFGWPKLLTFMDVDQNIIEEFPLQMTPFQNATRKICGSWNRLPKRYRRTLRRDELYAQLTSQSGEAISGKVAKYYGLASELFSGLLLAVDGQSAATAILSVSTNTGSVHAMILVSGIFGGKETDNIPLSVRFESTQQNGEKRIIEEILQVPKVLEGATTVDFKTVFDPLQLDSLGNGEMKMIVSTRASPQLAVSGLLSPKFTCDLFDCVLTPLAEENEEASSLPEDTPARGMAWMLMTRTGEIQYHVRIDDLQSTLSSIHLDNGKKSKRLLRIVDDLSPNFVDGWANGSLKLGARDLESLYKGDLYFNVATSDHLRELRGRIVPQIMTEAHELVRPVLLKGDQTKVSGIGWANVDSTCSLNYQVRISGGTPKSEFTLKLKDYPMDGLKNHATMPGRTLELQTFQGSSVEGTQSSIHKLTIARLDAGDASFLVTHHGEREAFSIEGRIIHVLSPPDCLPRYARNELELMPGFLSDLGEERPEVEKELANRCLYEGSIFEEGQQWEATHKKCQMCSCMRGKVLCEDMACPKLNCSQPIIFEGECCASCESDDVGVSGEKRCFFAGDQKFHTVGTRWHPYIPPFGFTRCATCTCNSNTMAVECSKMECPKLTCPLKEREIPDSLACCQVCREEAPVEDDEEDDSAVAAVSDPDLPHDQGQGRTDLEILSEGGCRFREDAYENGASWHPRIDSHGEMSCVNCKCKDGLVKCRKNTCQQLTCKFQVQDKGSCCSRCAANKAEMKQAKRNKKLRKIRKLRRIKQERQQEGKTAGDATVATDY